LYGGSPISGADSLVICSQNRFWYPKSLPPARSARMGVRKRILHPRRRKTACYGLTRRQKTPETPKNAIKPFGAQWIPEASGRRAALQHRPTADSGRANGWRTVGGMWTEHVRSYSTPTLVLGPRLRCVLAARASILPQNLGRNLTRPSYCSRCSSQYIQLCIQYYSCTRHQVTVDCKHCTPGHIIHTDILCSGCIDSLEIYYRLTS
jgi:hypothetical protein